MNHTADTSQYKYDIEQLLGMGILKEEQKKEKNHFIIV